MRFCFLINPTNDWQQAVKHCLHLAKQVDIHHKLIGVFFYGSSVNIVADTQLLNPWYSISNCPLYLCRTMIEEYTLTSESVTAPFEVIGMAPWINIMEQADRIVEII